MGTLLHEAIVFKALMQFGTEVKFTSKPPLLGVYNTPFWCESSRAVASFSLDFVAYSY